MTTEVKSGGEHHVSITMPIDESSTATESSIAKTAATIGQPVSSAVGAVAYSLLEKGSRVILAAADGQGIRGAAAQITVVAMPILARMYLT